MDNNKTLIVIAGPTAVGKTNLSIEIAQYFKCEIISADSRQFFKVLQCGTALPSKEQLQTIPHHFIGNLSVTDYFNVFKFETEVLSCLSKLFVNSHYALLVGGSGLYINAVCSGIDDMPDYDEKIREELINQFRHEGVEKLRTRLKDIDPEYYEKVDKSNHTRIIRAIEVYMQTGKPFSSFRKNEPKQRNFNIIKIGLNRDMKELVEIINLRTDKMISDGLIDEARELYKYKNLYSLQTLGYREIFDYLDNKTTMEQAIEKIKTNTRKYAKKQLTWFKKDAGFAWFHPDDKQGIIDYIKQFGVKTVGM